MRLHRPDCYAHVRFLSPGVVAQSQLDAASSAGASSQRFRRYNLACSRRTMVNSQARTEASSRKESRERQACRSASRMTSSATELSPESQKAKRSKSGRNAANIPASPESVLSGQSLLSSGSHPEKHCPCSARSFRSTSSPPGATLCCTAHQCESPNETQEGTICYSEGGLSTLGRKDALATESTTLMDGLPAVGAFNFLHYLFQVNRRLGWSYAVDRRNR